MLREFINEEDSLFQILWLDATLVLVTIYTYSKPFGKFYIGMTLYKSEDGETFYTEDWHNLCFNSKNELVRETKMGEVIK